jgi:hypothetical protein
VVGVDVVENGLGEEVFVEQAVADTCADFGGGRGVVEADEVRSSECWFEGGEVLEFWLYGVEGAAKDGPFDEGAEFVESVPVGKFRKVVGPDDEDDVCAGVFVAEFGDGVEGVAGAGAKGFARVDDTLGIFAKGFAEHGETVVRFGSWGRVIFVRISMSWDDADLTERELVDEGIDHRGVAVVDGIERAAEDDEGMRRVAHKG